MNHGPLKKILLVEDDPVFLKGMMYTIKQLGHEPLLATNGKEAVHVLKLHNVDAIVSDINMPNGNGLQLLNFVIKNYNIPVILMTGLNDLKEAQTAIKMGAKSFLSKPFKKADLKESLDACFEKKSASDTLIDAEMIKLHLEEFLIGDKMELSIFLKTNDSYIKISSGRENLTPEDIVNYRGDGIEFLFARKEDFINYLGLKGSVTFEQDDQLKNIVSQEVEKCFSELMFLRDMNKIAFDRARVHVETTVDILAECNDVQDKLRNLVEKKDFLVSLKVAFFGSLISQYMGNVSTKDYFKFNANSILDPQGHPVFAGVPYLEMTVTMIKSFLNFQEGFFDFSITLKRFVISSLGVYDLNILQALLMVFKQEEPQEVVEYQLSKLGDMV